MIGKTLAGRYNIISHLGSGGFGQTYLAEDKKRSGNPQCVVKQLKPQTNHPATIQLARRLFESETQVLHKLGTHPRIPELLDHFEENQEFYLLQEFIPGHDLGKEVSVGKRLSESYAIKLLKDILEILTFVHQNNVIHRDIKPENIRRRQDGKIFLIDFGAVKEISTQFVNTQGMTNLTVSIGTPGYMPNEQANRKPKFSSDIYAVGILGIQALTGLMPQELPEDTNGEILWRDRVQVSDNLAAILSKMVLYDFRQRYPTAVEALQAVTSLVTPSPMVSTVSTSAIIQPVQNPTQNISILMKKGDSLYDKQQYEEAINTYKEVLIIEPDNFSAWHYMAISLYQMGEYREAMICFDKIWNSSKFYKYSQESEQARIFCSQILYQRGIVLIERKLYSQALTSFEEALRIKPDNNDAKTASKALMSNRPDLVRLNIKKAEEKQQKYSNRHPEFWESLLSFLGV